MRKLSKFTSKNRLTIQVPRNCATQGVLHFVGGKGRGGAIASKKRVGHMEGYCPHGSLFDLISTDSNCKYVYDTLSGQAVLFEKKISSKVELLLQHCFALSCMISFVGKISALAPCRKLYRSERTN